MEMHHEWLAEAAYYLVTNKEWDIYYMHVHTPDWAYHTYINSADRATADSQETWKRFHEAEISMYKSLDRLIARIQSGADENETVFLLTSDHGAKPVGPNVNPGTILLQAGLVAFKPEKEKKEEEEEEFSGQFKWEKQETHATGDSGGQVRAPGRDRLEQDQGVAQPLLLHLREPEGPGPARHRRPQGLREGPGGDHRRAATTTPIPRPGSNPSCSPSRSRMPVFFDMGGDCCGDVIYAPHPHYQGPHGGYSEHARAGEMGDVRTHLPPERPGREEG